MKKEDFKEITKEQIELCREIVKQNGKCGFSGCKNCPFSIDNNTDSNAESCTAYTGETATYKENALAVKSAMEFIKLFEGDFIEDKKTFEVSNDKINSPNHYKLEGLNCETIDVVKARLGKEGFKSFCVGNILKYILRAEKKNGLEDYKKARKYLDWLIEREEK